MSEETFDSYYFSLESTGNKEIDTILSSVAFAGSMCHDTIDWAEDDHGGSVVDGIQQAANLAAKTINTQACDYEHEIKTLKARIKELEEETEFKSNQIEILKSDNKSKFKVIQNLKEIISTPPSTQEREE